MGKFDDLSRWSLLTLIQAKCFELLATGGALRLIKPSSFNFKSSTTTTTATILQSMVAEFKNVGHLPEMHQSNINADEDSITYDYIFNTHCYNEM